MRTSTLIAIATMSMWIAGEANAQQNNAGAQNAPGESRQEQVEGQIEGKGKRKRGFQGRRGKRGQGMEQDKVQDGQRRGRRGGAQMLDGLFTRFDKDKSGSISLAEAPERMKNRFETLDTNGDKAVSKEELQAAFGKMGQSRGDKGQGKGAKRKGKEGQGQRMDPAKMIQSMDKNNDGVISADEAPERMKQRFDQIDADSSGTISANELKAAFEKIKKGGKGKGGQIGRNKSADENATKPVKPKRPPIAKEGA